jgi:hypothetical protein
MSDSQIMFLVAAVLYILTGICLINHLSRGNPLEINTPYNFFFALGVSATFIGLILALIPTS